jgi:hypothetical protein
MAAQSGVPFLLVRHGADHDQYRLVEEEGP